MVQHENHQSMMQQNERYKLDTNKEKSQRIRTVNKKKTEHDIDEKYFFQKNKTSLNKIM